MVTSDKSSWQPTSLAAVEQQRLHALASYSLMCTTPEKEFYDLIAQASAICGTQAALAGLIAEGQQWYKARVGITSTEIQRAITFCKHAILDNEILEVPDTTADIRFYKNPFVTGDPNVRFYAGAPLVNAAGYKLGTICVIDTEPRELTEEQKNALAALSEKVVALMELRRQEKHSKI